MTWSCAKSQIVYLEFCKCERYCWNIWVVSGNIENDDKYSDEEEYSSKDEDDTDNLLE